VLEGTLVDTPLGKLAAHWHGELAPTGPRVTILIRPEQIGLQTENDEGGLSGRVVKSGYHGHDAVVHVQVGQGHTEQVLVVRAPGDIPLSPGANVRLSARGPVLVWSAPSVNWQPGTAASAR
jgi:ABC-type Fe3+/spermidine/putrescine transport system ATPase subunit